MLVGITSTLGRLTPYLDKSCRLRLSVTFADGECWLGIHGFSWFDSNLALEKFTGENSHRFLSPSSFLRFV